MKCRVIQADKINDSNKAEKMMLEFLQRLPEQYCVYRELKIIPAFEEKLKGCEKRKPDFVVTSKEVNLISIEVKDWDINHNTYEWKDQYSVIKKNNGASTTLGNPYDQAEKYFHAFDEILKTTRPAIASLVAFPRISRQDLLNKIVNAESLTNPQSKFYLDFQNTIFKEDIDLFRNNPESVLEKIAKARPRYKVLSDEEIDRLNSMILPATFKIGEIADRRQHMMKLKLISEEQESWIFNTDKKHNYLLDVAGSGKTNVLISKAMRVADVDTGTRILITTYNKELEKNIRKIFESKINHENNSRYSKAISIKSITTIVEEILKEQLGDANTVNQLIAQYKTYDELEKACEQDVTAYFEGKDRGVFDYVFIDEIQDFNDFMLIVLKKLNRRGDFFFVGDICQKLFKRSYNLNKLGLVSDRIELQKSYKMYRNPRYIAELATKFIISNPEAKTEFEENGYRENFQWVNSMDSAAVIALTADQEKQVCDITGGFIRSGYRPEDIMIVTSPERLNRTKQLLNVAGLKSQIGETETNDIAICVIDFMDAKGIERPNVIISGIEDLYNAAKAGVTEDTDKINEKEFLSRKEVYIALTRSVENLSIVCSDDKNAFISELMVLNAKITKNRGKQSV